MYSYGSVIPGSLGISFKRPQALEAQCIELRVLEQEMHVGVTPCGTGCSVGRRAGHRESVTVLLDAL